MKKRILTIALVVALLATCFSGTMAYLKDRDVQVNTFTTGNVSIDLDEAKVVKDEQTGNLVATDERISTTQNYHLFPGMTVTKDPTITVDENSEDAWVAAKVTVSAQPTEEMDLYDLIGLAGTDLININAVASGGLLAKTSTAVSNWNGLALVHETADCVIYQVAGDNTWTLYIFMKAVQVANTKTVLFDTLTIPTEWDNAEMDVVDTLEINVQAFATQANGFDDCFTAMTKAFATDFPFATNP